MKNLVLAYLAVVLLLSLVTFTVYGFDKRRARLDGRRISENTLHVLSVLGGWPGALAGQQVFRHKTRKFRFQVIFWMSVVVHVAAAAAVAVFLWNRAPGAS